MRMPIHAITYEFDPEIGPVLRVFADETEAHEVASASREGVSWNARTRGVVCSMVAQWHEDMVKYPDDDFSRYATHTQQRRGRIPERIDFPPDQYPKLWALAEQVNSEDDDV